MCVARARSLAPRPVIIVGDLLSCCYVEFEVSNCHSAEEKGCPFEIAKALHLNSTTDNGVIPGKKKIRTEWTEW